MTRDDDQEDEPLELVPLDADEDEGATRAVLPGEEEPADEPLPGASPVRSDEPIRTPETQRRLQAEEEMPEPPRLSGGNLGAIVAWPLRGEPGQNLLMAAMVYVLALGAGGVVGFLVGHLPIVGPSLAAISRTLFALAGLLFLLELAWHLVEATLRGRLAAQSVFGGTMPTEGLRLTLLGVVYFAPAVIIGLGTSSVVGALVAIAAWALFPAAVVLSAATGRLSEGNPVTASRFVRRAGRPWLFVAALVVPLLVTRLLVGGGILGLAVEGVSGLILVYALLIAALIARESEQVAALLAEIDEE